MPVKFPGLLLATALYSTHAMALQCSVNFSNGHFANFPSLHGAAATQTLPFSFSCSAPIAEQLLDRRVTLCIGLGSGSGGSYSDSPAGTRKLSSNAGDILQHEVYRDSGHQLRWGSLLQGNIAGQPKTIRLQLRGDNRSTLATASGQDGVHVYMKPGQASAVVGHYQSTFSGADVELMYDYSTRMQNCDAASSNVETGHSGFVISADIQGQCSVSTQTLDFGETVSLQQERIATGQLQLQCANQTPFQIALSSGLHANPEGSRQMRSESGEFIQYTLFQDAARTAHWGDNPNSNTLSQRADGQIQNIPIYGLVPAQEMPGAGQYSDRIVVTVSF